MPRPKGSKNKKTLLAQPLDTQIAAAEAEVEKLSAELKAKKAELKTLLKAKAKADKAAAKKQLEENREKILDAVAASGKSVEEVLELLK